MDSLHLVYAFFSYIVRTFSSSCGASEWYCSGIALDNDEMSTLRNSVQRRNHKERAQPLERQRRGLLEKHKDYVLRARDYKAKQTRLRSLRGKAEERNPDEFYFRMAKESVVRGRPVVERGNKTLDDEQMRLLRTQDAGYVRTLMSQEQRTIERLDGVKEGHGKHVVFVDSVSDVASFDPASYFQTHPDLVSRRMNRPTLDQLTAIDYESKSVPYAKAKKQLQTARAKAVRQLEDHVKRKDKLKDIEKEMELQRNLLTKGERQKTVSEEGKTIYKWKQQRKR